MNSGPDVMPKKILKIASLLLLLSLILLFIYYRQSRPHDLEIYFLNVGQGDSVLIRTPNNNDILIDGGPDKSVLNELGKILPFYDRDIELMILTHPHDDHDTGLISVINKYQVDKVLFNDFQASDAMFLEFKKIIQEKNISSNSFYQNDQIVLDNNIILKSLYPIKDLPLDLRKNANNTSIIAQLIYKNNKILFTGDAEQDEEKMILDRDLKSDILKVGHHGSKTATSLDFLNRINPQEAIISCGQDNKFKHPHFITVYRLQQKNINIFRTDQDGTIKCNSNGIKINCQKLK